MSTKDPLAALRAAVESHDRYAELTGRQVDCLALHPEHAREVLKLLTKLSAPKDSTKFCSECQSTNLVLLSTMRLKICGECGHEMSWKKDEGQPNLVGSNREGRKSNK